MRQIGGMRRMGIVVLWAVWSLGGQTLSLRAEDQRVRPAALSLDSGAQLSDRVSASASAPTQRASGDSLAVPLERSGGSLSTPQRNHFFSGPVATIAGALAITLGLFAVVVVIARRGGSIHPRGLPREAFEVIGQTAIGPRQRLMIVRVGTQALVIGTSPAGIQTVAQFDDPDEAGQLIAQCRGTGASAAFRTTLSELEREPASGFVDPPSAKRGNLFFRA